MGYAVGICFGVVFFVWVVAQCSAGTKRGLKSINDIHEGVHTWAKNQKK